MLINNSKSVYSFLERIIKESTIDKDFFISNNWNYSIPGLIIIFLIE